jgi:hypothetical protein
MQRKRRYMQGGLDTRDRRKHILSTVASFRDRKFGWNGSEGLPMRSDARNLAFALFTVNYGNPVVPSEVLRLCPFPDVVLGEDGTIAITFSTPGRELDLSIKCTSIVTFIKFFEDETTSVSGVLNLSADDEDPFRQYAEFTELFIWLIRE